MSNIKKPKKEWGDLFPKRRRGRRRLLNKDIKIVQRALNVIEGITYEDVATPPEKKITEIYKFAHIAIGDCQCCENSQWIKELEDWEKALVAMGITNFTPDYRKKTLQQETP